VKILLDACVWGGAKALLEGLGHDVVWCGDLGDDPGDEAILLAATREGRVLVTLDKDFGELAVVRGVQHAGIIRLVGFAARDQAPACHEVLVRHGTELLAGALATARPGQLRLRPPPGTDDPR
jgi:predicted nuclease of predicted toxin-antitoxin system